MSMNFKQIIKTLKTAIKSRGITYKELAQKMDMSEAGMKRLLNAEDCSLKRILQICRVIGVSLEDLLAITSEVEKEVQYFTKSQIDLFEQSIDHLKYYYKLRVEYLSPDEIQLQWQLSTQENQKFLRDLDKVDLIQLLPGDKIAKFDRSDIQWPALGDVLRKFKFAFVDDLVSYFKQNNAAQNSFFPIYHLHLSNQTCDELVHSLQKLIDEFVKRAIHENLSLKKENIHPFNITFMIAPKYGFDYRRNSSGK